MTDVDFLELVRRVMKQRVFGEATSAVIILYSTKDDSIASYCQGYYDMDEVENIIEAGQEILEDLRNAAPALPEHQQ